MVCRLRLTRIYKTGKSCRLSFKQVINHLVFISYIKYIFTIKRTVFDEILVFRREVSVRNRGLLVALSRLLVLTHQVVYVLRIPSNQQISLPEPSVAA